MYSDLEYKNKVVVGLIITLALLFFCTGVSVYQYLLPVVTLKVEGVTIRQDDAMPELNVQVEYKGKENVVLDHSTGYTANTLVEELNQGNGYQMAGSVDNTKEGVYPLDLDLTEELKEKFSSSWNQKIRYEVEDATVTVLNKYGDWEGNKFKMLDGNYAIGWYNIGMDTYYFGEDGNYMTDEVESLGSIYYFNEDGRFDTEKNLINPNRPMVALTFDDGPGLKTEELLDALQAHNARATFFMMAERVNLYPNALRKMVEIGCELANHTTNHVKLTEYDIEDVIWEINSTRDAIQGVAGESPTMMRPPFGAVNEEVQSVAETPIVLWSLDTTDWQLKEPGLVKDYILQNVKDGDIVLLHDIYEATVQASIELIPLLQEQGYQLVTVSEMARARGITLENGMKYYNFYK